MFYVYILRSKKDGKFYIGHTNNLRKRIDAHNNGKIISTKYRKPFELIYYEASHNKEDALIRERYLKTTYGHRYIHNRLKNFFKK